VCVHAIKEKRLELSTPDLVHLNTHQPRGQKVKGQGHAVMKCAASEDMHAV